MHLYLIRHGQSYVNLPDWDGGNTDEGLTELGQRQAQALGQWLPGQIKSIDTIYCSTMKRARETAAPVGLAYQKPILYDDRIREVGNNRLDHTPWPNDSLPRNYGDFWGSERPFSSITPAADGGESLMHFKIRIGHFLEELIVNHQKETILVVAHGGVIEMFFDLIFNIGPWRRCEVWTKNTGVTRFEHVAHPLRETWRLHYQSKVEHYQLMDSTPA